MPSDLFVRYFLAFLMTGAYMLFVWLQWRVPFNNWILQLYFNATCKHQWHTLPDCYGFKGPVCRKCFIHASPPKPLQYKEIAKETFIEFASTWLYLPRYFSYLNIDAMKEAVLSVIKFLFAMTLVVLSPVILLFFPLIAFFIYRYRNKTIKERLQNLLGI